MRLRNVLPFSRIFDGYIVVSKLIQISDCSVRGKDDFARKTPVTEARQTLSAKTTVNRTRYFFFPSRRRNSINKSCAAGPSPKGHPAHKSGRIPPGHKATAPNPSSATVACQIAFSQGPQNPCDRPQTTAFGTRPATLLHLRKPSRESCRLSVESRAPDVTVALCTPPPAPLTVPCTANAFCFKAEI